MADAAAVALADPNNPYAALRKFVDSQVHQLEEAELDVADITTLLTDIKLKGGWSIPIAVRKQELLRALAAPPAFDSDPELLFLRTASGEIVQVISTDEKNEEPKQITSSE